MKTLVLVGHPEYDNSQTAAFLRQAQVDLNMVDWQVLQPTSSFDTMTEQQRLMKYDRIILQFPMYWYSAPAIMKQYLDEVLTVNFVDVRRDGCLRGKELGIVVTLGDPLKDYQSGGREDVSLSELLKPYQAIAHKAGMRFLPSFPVAQFAYMTPQAKQQLLIDYRGYLANSNFDTFKGQQSWYLQQLAYFKSQLSPEKQSQLSIIMDYLDNNAQQLDELNWELALIKKEEDE
jgi:glutathione-regulated potassium-efflux system ancillary protein KefG